MSTVIASIIVLTEAAIAIAVMGGVPAALGYGVCCAFKRRSGSGSGST